MSATKVANKLYARLAQDVPALSDYAKVLFHPSNFSQFLPHLHKKINGCYQSFSLTFDEIDWDDMYPHLLSYTRTADPVGTHRERHLMTLKDAHVDLLDHLGDYFVHLSIGSQQKYNNFLREQAGTWAYKASMAIAPRYPMERPFTESTLGGKLMAQDEHDNAIETYFVSKSPYVNALDRAKETEKFTYSFFENGGW